MTNSVYISGTGPGSGKSLVVLGVMELFAGRCGKVGFFRPLVADAAGPDRLTSLVAGRYGTAAPFESAFGAASDVARDLLTRGREEELLARIVEAYRRLAQACEFVVCAGTDYRALHTALEFEFNVEVARNLGAPLLAVIAGQGRTDGELADAVRVLAGTLEERKCDLLATIVNRVDPAVAAAAAAALRSAEPGGAPVFVVPADPLLDKPTVGEIKEALGAELLHGDAQRLEGKVLHYKVAAMELPHFLDRLEEGSLVITPGDRADIVIGTLLADAATTYPGVAGVVLTGGFAPAPQVRRLFAGLKRTRVPILSVPADTFTTATAVTTVYAGIAAGSARKIARALGVFESSVDRGRLGRRIAVMRSSRVTPLMFQSDLLSRARADRRHIVLPEGAEERILRAAEIVRLRGVADLTLLGHPAEVGEKITALGLSLAGVRVVDPLSRHSDESGSTTRTPASESPSAAIFSPTSAGCPSSVRSATPRRRTISAARRIRSSAPSGSTMWRRSARARLRRSFWNISGVTREERISSSAVCVPRSRPMAITRECGTCSSRSVPLNRPEYVLYCFAPGALMGICTFLKH